jgi:hypothetical protein
MVSGETLYVLKKALVEVMLGRRPLHTWMFAAEITD